jgi:hypothetical protein
MPQPTRGLSGPWPSVVLKPTYDVLTKLLDLDVEAEVTDETTAVLSTSQKGSKPTKLAITHRVGSNSICAVGSTGPVVRAAGAGLSKLYSPDHCALRIKTSVDSREHQIGGFLEDDGRIAHGRRETLLFEVRSIVAGCVELEGACGQEV